MVHKLTVAIPTYNPNIKFLKEALYSIAAACVTPQPEVQILVVSNGSNSESVSNIRKIESEFDQVEFLYETTNLGYDRNVDRLFEHAKGDFVWIFGDDDLLFTNSLVTVLNSLDNAQGMVSFVIVRPTFFTRQVPALISDDAQSETQIVDIKGDLGFSELGFLPAAVSTVCIKKSAWKSLDSDFAYGSNWIHFIKIEQLLSSNSYAGGLLIQNELVAIRRADEARWVAHFGSQYSSGLTLLEASNAGIDKGISSEVVSWIYSKRFKTNFLDLLWLYRPNCFSDKTAMFARQRDLFGSEVRFWLLDVPAIFMPNSLRNFVVKVLSKAKSILSS